MRRFNLGKNIRIDGPQSHMSKMGTPAMGGLLIVIWTVAISILVNIVQLFQATEIAESVAIPLGVMFAYSILGGIDDYQGFRLRPGEGMQARVKIWYQLGIALAAALVIYFGVNGGLGLTAVPTVPFSAQHRPVLHPISRDRHCRHSQRRQHHRWLGRIGWHHQRNRFRSLWCHCFYARPAISGRLLFHCRWLLFCLFGGLTPNRPKCLWVMSVRKHWVVHWVSSH